MSEANRVYEIRLRAHLNESWIDLFESLSLRNEKNGEAVITVPAADQALLHGVLGRIRDLNLSLVSVRQIRQAPASAKGRDGD